MRRARTAVVRAASWQAKPIHRSEPNLRTRKQVIYDSKAKKKTSHVLTGATRMPDRALSVPKCRTAKRMAAASWMATSISTRSFAVNSCNIFGSYSCQHMGLLLVRKHFRMQHDPSLAAAKFEWRNAASFTAPNKGTSLSSWHAYAAAMQQTPCQWPVRGGHFYLLSS